MGEGAAGPELADCKARGDRELKNVVLQREDLIVELSKKRGELAQDEKKKQMQKNEGRLEKFRGVGTENNFSCSLLN